MYSKKLRKEAVKLVIENNLDAYEVGQRLSVPVWTVQRWIRMYKKTLPDVDMKAMLSKKESRALRLIANSLMHRGKAPTVGELGADMGYKYRRGAYYIVRKLVQKGFIRKRRNAGSWQLTEDVDYSHATLNGQTFEKLYAMKLVGMAEALKEQMERPEMNDLSFEERFAMLVDAQYLFRENKRMKRM
jgi:transposase